VEQFNVSALHDAVVQIGQTILSTNRHVVKWAVVAILGGFTTAVVLFGDALASDHAVIGVCDIVVSTDGLEQVSRAIAGGH
jgi:hypothetical protein